jgi:hypothetical protein
VENYEYLTREELRKIILDSRGVQISEYDLNIFKAVLISNEQKEITKTDVYDFYRKFYQD